MSRNLKRKQSSTNLCPLCQSNSESTEQVFQCPDSCARTNRSKQILDLKNNLKSLITVPIIINHIARAIYQFSSNVPVSLITINPSSSVEQQNESNNTNQQLCMGTLSLLSGFPCQDVSTIQQHYMDGLKLEQKPNMYSWSWGAIKALLNFPQAIWKFRSDNLHNEATFAQEKMLWEQAIQLLTSLRSTPFRLPKTSNSLLTQTKDYLQISHLRNITSWTKRVNRAIEEHNFNERTSSIGIRTWLYSETITSNEAYELLELDKFFREYNINKNSIWDGVEIKVFVVNQILVFPMFQYSSGRNMLSISSGMWSCLYVVLFYNC